MSVEHFRKLERMYHAAPVNKLYDPRLEVEEGRAFLTMKVNKEFFHAAGALHGSVYFKALDDAAFFAASSLVAEHFVVTASFHLYLLRPVQSGVLRAEGRVTAASGSQYLADAELYCDGELVARGAGSFRRSKMRLEDVDTYR